jgi:hypothetical protein
MVSYANSSQDAITAVGTGERPQQLAGLLQGGLAVALHRNGFRQVAGGGQAQPVAFQPPVGHRVRGWPAQVGDVLVALLARCWTAMIEPAALSVSTQQYPASSASRPTSTNGTSVAWR